MRSSPRTPTRTPLLLLAVVVAACADTPAEPALHGTVSQAGGRAAGQPVQAALGPDFLAFVAQLRRSLAPFHRIELAASAGYDTRLTECMESEAGGMGYHYGDLGLLDGTVEPLRPELLLYEPGPGGKLRLVAVEYAVPYGAWTSPTPPALEGVSFHRNDAFGLWILHVWTWKHNPAGMLEDWNPRVSCAFAA